MTDQIAAHDQKITHSYTVHYPEHSARADDPHYAAFEAYRKSIQGTDKWKCAVGVLLDDFSECSLDQPLELHHSVIEFATANEVDLAAIEKDFPQITDEASLAAFVESEGNTTILCVFHHRGRGGVHTASYADFEAEKYVKGLIS